MTYGHAEFFYLSASLINLQITFHIQNLFKKRFFKVSLLNLQSHIFSHNSKLNNVYKYYKDDIAI